MGLVEILEPVYSVIPSVKMPEVEPPLKRKLMWSGIVLLLFFVLGRISLLGLPPLAANAANPLAAFQEILASRMGTLLSAGIGPIVFASIILQLLVGGKIIDIDLTDPKGKAKFQGMQKLFAIIMCFFEGIIYPMSGMVPNSGPFNVLVLGTQIAIGSIILLYLDEVVSKYGIGSGIGLFIAGGVAVRFFWQILMPPGVAIQQPAGGLIFRFFENMTQGAPNYAMLLPVIVAVIIYLVVTYANAIHVNIPITMGRRGFGGRYPVNLLYVNVLPVILSVALFANIRMWGAMTAGVPILGTAMQGLTWVTGNAVPDWGPGFDHSIYNLFNYIIGQVGASGFTILGRSDIQLYLLQGLIYLVVLSASCILFGKFWVKMGGQSPEDIANQLESSGMYIPGFRRDKRIIEKILNRYIPPIVIIGSIFVGLLAGIGNMALGTLGSGTGILLTVGIVYRLYEQIARAQLKESHSLLKKLLG